MMEAISWLLTPKPSASNSPMTEEEDLQHSHRLNPGTRQLSEADQDQVSKDQTRIKTLLSSARQLADSRGLNK